MVITKLALLRCTFLRGVGATMVLPLLDAMVLAMKAAVPVVSRFASIYFGNGANMLEWTFAVVGVGFELSPIFGPLAAFRDRMMVFTGLDNFPVTDQGDVGGQYPRAALAFMSCMHPKQIEGADVEAGTIIDQIIVERICRDTKLQSFEVFVDRNDVVGVCDHGYACAYMNSLAWKNPMTSLLFETNPRFVFERLFGIGATVEERQVRIKEDRSILDGLIQQILWLNGWLGARDRTKLGEYFDVVRDLEQCIVKVESYNSDFSVLDQSVGVLLTFREYVELMFDLQVLAFQADITRVSSFMMVRENINRSYPEIGLLEVYHSMLYYGNNPEKMKAFAKLNTYHVEIMTYFLKKLEAIPDGDGNLLDHTIVLYGGGMSDGNMYNNYNVFVVTVGGRGLSLKGDCYVAFPKGTSLANLMFGIMDRFGA